MAESTVYRQVVTTEVFLLVPPGQLGPPQVDMAGLFRDFVTQADFGNGQPWPVCGEVELGDLEHLEVTYSSEPCPAPST